MTTSNDIPLAAKPIDRAAHHRTDNDWLEAAVKRADVLIFLMQKGKPLIEGGRPDRTAQIGARPGDKARNLVWLGPEAIKLEPRAEMVFLGKDKAGAPIFAVNMAEGFRLEGSLIEGLGDFEDMRSAAATLPEMQANLASTARSILEWHRSHRFCSRCGGESVELDRLHRPQTGPIVRRSAPAGCHWPGDCARTLGIPL